METFEPLVFQAVQDGAVSNLSPTLRVGSHDSAASHFGVLTSSAGDSPARTYQWPVNVRAFRESEAASGLSSIASCPSCGQPLRSLRMFPDFYPRMAAAISESSSTGWANSGLLSAGQYWTASTSESRSAAAASTLSQVLQEQVSSKYFLSAKAATGILRRAERRGKELPVSLRVALQALAATMNQA